jgi:acylphosphatase
MFAAAFAVGAAMLPAGAHALTFEEATTVVDLIEVLQDELGSFAYDEEIAADWFEQDADGEGWIARAGFTEESWERALGETIKGFMANMPDAEVEETFNGLKQGIAALPQLTDAQKADALAAVDEEFAAYLSMRAEGQSFAPVVKPLDDRLRRLLIE